MRQKAPCAAFSYHIPPNYKKDRCRGFLTAVFCILTPRHRKRRELCNVSHPSLLYAGCFWLSYYLAHESAGSVSDSNHFPYPEALTSCRAIYRIRGFRKHRDLIHAFRYFALIALNEVLEDHLSRSCKRVLS